MPPGGNSFARNVSLCGICCWSAPRRRFPWLTRVVEELRLLRPQGQLPAHHGGALRALDGHGQPVVGLLASQLQRPFGGPLPLQGEPLLGIPKHLVDQASLPIRQLLLHVASCSSLPRRRWRSRGSEYAPHRSRGSGFAASILAANRACRIASGL